MSILSRHHRWPIVGVALLIGGCGSDLQHALTSSGQPCEVLVDGVKYFVGDEACFRALPMTTMSGYWVHDHEYSVFYKGLQAVPPGYDDNASWLDLSKEARAKAPPLLDSQSDLFEVTFVGVDPDRVGMFGNGTRKRGVFADRILKLKQVSRP